jgi:hypothetical protein
MGLKFRVPPYEKFRGFFGAIGQRNNPAYQGDGFWKRYKYETGYRFGKRVTGIVDEMGRNVDKESPDYKDAKQRNREDATGKHLHTGVLE